MEPLDTEIKTVDTLLSRGVRVDLPAPWLLRRLGKKTLHFVMKNPTNRTMLRISRQYLLIQKAADNLEPEAIGEAHHLMLTCSSHVSRVVAYAMIQSNVGGWLFNRWLAWWLRGALDNRQIAEMCSLVVSLAGAHDFLNTIRSISSLRITMPRMKKTT